MQIKLTSVLVEEQSRAEKFYTEVLGFVKKHDIPMGEVRWLTVVSPEGPSDIELLLEPMAFAPARVYQKALFEAGIPAASFFVKDIHAEHARMKSLGVKFRSEPKQAGPVTIATFEDKCGNLIQLCQVS